MTRTNDPLLGNNTVVVLGHKAVTMRRVSATNRRDSAIFHVFHQRAVRGGCGTVVKSVCFGKYLNYFLSHNIHKVGIYANTAHSYKYQPKLLKYYNWLYLCTKCTSVRQDPGLNICCADLLCTASIFSQNFPDKRYGPRMLTSNTFVTILPP